MQKTFSRLTCFALLFLGLITFATTTAHAASVAVVAGKAVTLTVDVSGTAPFTYAWYKDGSVLSGAVNSTFAISNFQTANSGSYHAVVTNALGSTTSDAASLSLGTSGSTAPAFTTQPASQTVNSGADATFTAAASGSPAPTYQWRFNGTNISGATGSSYTRYNSQVATAGAYTVVATNSAGSATSSTATLAINGGTGGATAPAFTTQPASKAVNSGADVTFTAVASGSPAPTYQWRFNGTNISGATGSSYTRYNSQVATAGAYTVVATNSAGSATSNTATLSINGTTVAPVITTQPASQTVTAGNNVTFTAAASGTPAPTYQWRKNGTNISGATSASYALSSVTSGSAGTYTVVATNSAGSATSSGAVLTVNAANVAPVITTQPASQTVTAGNNVTFTTAASGTPAPTYQWRKNGTNISGATSASYALTSVTSGSAGTYTVVATNSAGSATSNGAVLTVNVPNTTPTISGLAGQSTAMGTSVGPLTFTVGDVETAVGSLTVSGVSSNPTLVPNAGIVLGGSGANRSVTLTPAINQTGTATITLTVSDGSASASVNFTLTVTAAPTNPVYLAYEAEAGTLASPMVAASDGNASGGTYVVSITDEMGTVTLPVNIAAAGTYVIWARILSPNTGTDSFYVSADGGAEETYSTAQNNWSASWQWTAVNAVGLSQRSFQWGAGLHNIVFRGREVGTKLDRILVTNDPAFNPVTNTAPTISDITSQTISAGTSTGPRAFTVGDAETTAGSLVVTGSSSNTTLVPNSAVVLGGSGASRTATVTPAAGQTGTATITLTASDGLLTATDTFVLTVNSPTVAPAFTTQPASQTVTAGNNVTFTAAASGTPTPTYQWRKNGTNISGATSASYALTSVTTSSAGTYTVVATNSAGSATSSGAVLTVNPATVAPAFTTQPASQTVTAGNNVTFTAAASGTPTPTYQWRKNGTNISGATSASYALTSVTTSSAGTYTVVASNSAGSVTSNGAVLTVNAATVAPVFTTQPGSRTVTVGNNVTFTAAASGTPTPTYQWRKNGSKINGATSASYALTSVTTSSAGTYTVVATNSAGSATSNGAVLTVNAATVAPAFTTQPASQTVTAGNNVTFTAAASGTPAPTYQWRKNGTNISGATSASYALTSVTTSSAGTYTVVATNSAGSVTSNGAVLTVSAANAAPTASFSLSGQRALGQTVTVTVTVGDPDGNYSYANLWVSTPGRGWVAIKADSSTVVSNQLLAANTVAATAGMFTRTFAFTPTDGVGSYTFSLSAVDALGLRTNTPLQSITVTAATVAPAFTTQPASQTVTAGNNVTFTAAASGTPAPTYQWRKNGTNISGATSASYALTSVTSGSAGTYTVVATNSAGSATSSGAVLTVNAANVAPAITTQPAGQTVAAGNYVTFTVAASGSPAPTYQWRKNGTNISGAASASYTLSTVTAGNAGTYSVVVTNSLGSVTSNGAVLTVNSASSPVYLSYEAEAASLVAPMTVATEANASGGSYVIVKGDETGTATWSVNIPVAGAYIIWSRILAPNNSQDSMYVSVDGGAEAIYSTAPVRWSAAWQWSAVNQPGAGLTARTFQLSAGTHNIVFRGREKNTAIDRIVVTNDAGYNPTIVKADFNQDGNADLLWQNSVTGETSLWLMNGTSVGDQVPTGTMATAWQMRGFGDFNKDGQPDILWQNSVTGECAVWLMAGTNLTTVVSLGVISLDWEIDGSGDFNGDGNSDILWQNSVTGECIVWLMAGTNTSSSVSLGTTTSDWHIVGSGDFNRDGQADILWHNSVTGEGRVWLMAGTNLSSAVSLGVVSTDWEMGGGGDYNKDGQTDILWQNNVTGERVVWLMAGTSMSSTASLGVVSTDWILRN